MEAGTRIGTDWRDGAAYAPLLSADRALLAWEWLRRDPAYRSAAGARAGRPGRFGLVAFEPPELGVPDARPVWSAGVHPHVLSVRPLRARAPGADLFDISAMGQLARTVADAAGEHLLLSDGLRSIRLDGPAGTFSCGAVELGYSLSGIIAAQAPLLALRRFLALAGTGRFSSSLHPLEARARRWVLMLRTWDALRSGAGQRDIAQVLLSRSAQEPRWRTREPSIRSQAQRLARSARAMGVGGYRSLLR